MPSDDETMTKVLLIYASTHGHTARIAGRLAERLRAHELDVDLHNLGSADDPSPTDYDAVVAAGSVHRGHHQRELVDWVRYHRLTLADRPSAFVSVSLTAAEKDEEARAATQHMVDVFVEETGWTPSRTECVAGALQYREYDVFTRTLMRLMMRHGGHPTDVSQDYDYTDWDGVERLAAELAELVESKAAAQRP